MEKVKALRDAHGEWQGEIPDGGAILAMAQRLQGLCRDQDFIGDTLGDAEAWEWARQLHAIAMEARQGGDGDNSAPSEGRQRGPKASPNHPIGDNHDRR